MQNEKTYEQEMRESSTDNENVLPVLPLFGFDNSDEIEQDVHYMKSFFPNEVLQILNEIEKECDKLEYDGSPMYSAYPDKVYFESIANKILAKFVKTSEGANVSATDLGFPSFHDGHCFGVGCPPRPPYGCYGGYCDHDRYNPWLKHTINSLFFNELLNRRRRYRSYKRIF